MNFFDVIILGIVEGITEFLPVSSTLHIDFFSRLLQIQSTPFLTSFIIGIQLGAIIAIAILFRNRFIKSPTLLRNTIIGFIPIGVVGLLVYPLVKNVLLGNLVIEIITLSIGGIVFLIFGKKYQRSMEHKQVETVVPTEISLKEMFILGCWQVLALIPGVSRSGAILIGGLVHKMRMDIVVLSAFFLAIPTMFVATGYDLYKTGSSFSGQEWGMLIVGMVTAGVVAYAIALRLIRFMQKRDALYVFGIYRLLLAVVLLVFLLQR